MKLSKIRKEYSGKSLSRSDLNNNPFEQFRLWIEEVIKLDLTEPNAMILATATPEGKPSSPDGSFKTL